MVRVFGIALVLALAACDVVLGLDEPPTCRAEDEDCDGQLNDLDACPADADEPSDDDDDDGVGNQCDPERGLPGDRIREFDGFDDNRHNWTQTGAGGWRREGGAFVREEGDGIIELAVTPVATRPSVAAVITNLTGPIDGRAGVRGTAGASSMVCQVVIKDGGEVLLMEAFLLSRQGPLAGTGPIRIQAGQLADGALYCRARHGDDPDVLLQTGPGIQIAKLDKFGLISSGAAARVTSITLFDVPPP